LSVRTKTVSQKDKMLDAAAQLFGTQRFHEVRMEDIAAQAEVGKGTLYRYFSDKEELYLALLHRASDQWLKRLEEEIEQTEGARARLVTLVAAVLDHFDHQPHLLDLIQRAEVLRGSGPEFPWHRVRTEFSRRLLAIFQEGKARGEFVIRDPELSALMLGGALRSVIRFGKQPRPRDLADRFVSTFLEGAAVPG
jgi:AcrR family transcriptional regulator